MVRLNCMLKGLGMVMLATMAACKKSITLKTLVLSTFSGESESIIGNLNSYGIPFDYIEFSPSNQLKGNLTLYDENNEPKYNLVVINGGYLSYETNNTWVSALNKEQWAYLEEYEAKNSVRRVVLSEDISYNPEIKLQDQNNWGETKDKQDLIVADDDEIKNIFKEARVKITAPLDVNGIYHSRVKIVNTNTTLPFLYYSDDGEKSAVAATITKYEDGREKMSFYFGFGSWSQSSIMLGHLWLTWGTRSLFNGFRRVYFTPHIDDVFLSTELVDVKHNVEYSKYSEEFRTKPEDYQKIAQFQKDVLDIMPEGSFYRVELAFNGNGLLLSVDYDQALEVDGERYVDLEFVKEPGTGDKRWPKENYQFTKGNLSTFEKDDLYKYFAHNETAQREFFWSSHTFTHENLDNASRSDVDNEIRLNIEVADMLGLTEKEYWSGGAIITPQISGLHNKDALEIFRKYGINSATGDLSRPAICNVSNPYLPYYTTMESSNLEGFPVVPRTPTEIYYFCSSREENTWMYNQIYHNYFGKDSTWDEIAERESKRTLLLMTKLRHEAHQFHQANLRYYKKEGEYGESLLEDWTRSVVKLYTKYVDWPLISIKIDRQAETFIERAKLEACGHETKLVIENNKIVGITVTASEGECTVPVTVPEGVDKSSLPSDATLEQIGKDPLTVWVPLKKGETKTFKIEPALEWHVDETAQPVENTTTVTVVESTTTVKEEETTTEAEPTTTKKEETTTEAEPTTTKKEETTTEVEPTTTKKEETTTEVEPTTTKKEETTTEAEPSTTKKEETTTEVEPTTTKKEETTTEVEPTTTKKEETTTEAEPTTPKKEETTTEVEPTTTKKEETTAEAEPTTTKKEETTSEAEPTTTKKEETTAEAEPTTTKKEETTTEAEPTTTKKEETTAEAEPTTTNKEEEETSIVTIYETSTVDVTIVESSTIYVDPTTTVVEKTTTTTKAPTTTTTTEKEITSTEEETTTTTTTTEKKTTTTTTEKKTTKTTTDDEPTETPTEKCNAGWARCGGIGFAGVECCVEGYYCKKQNEWYSQCVPRTAPKEDDDENDETTTVTTITKTKTVTKQPTTKTTVKTTITKTKTTTIDEESTTAAAEETTKTSIDEEECSGPYQKCGGIGFTGPHCCVEGWTCKDFNDYYSQCVKI